MIGDDLIIQHTKETLMGTLSMIGRYNEDGSVTAVYCHWDGYVAHNGKILDEHYTTDEKIQDLISLGDLSGLGAELGEKHPFSLVGYDEAERAEWEAKLKDKSWCTFYHRDRGETLNCYQFEDVSDYRKNGPSMNGAEYLYLWDSEAWFVTKTHGDNAGVWDDVREALKDPENA